MTMNTNGLTVKEIGKKYGISRMMLQLYERIGLIQHIGRNKYGHLYYNLDMEKRILYIRHLQLCGFTLPEIKEMFELTKDELKKKLIIKVDELNINADSISKLAIRTGKIIDALDLDDNEEIIKIIKEDYI